MPDTNDTSDLMPEPSAAKGEAHIITLGDMYQDYFLDYASYVILERAVPGIVDGLKPVQRRLLHAINIMDDGRYHKVANVIGQTMQYHPHGDASIGDALVNLGQKDLLIDCQGNWGDARTGDSAAAARYIEARLTKFALDILYNPQTTEWQLTYDGRKKEPVALPSKFPLVLAQGVEGIAVGLSTKILPHNFIELIKASLDILKGKPFQLFPDFFTGGFVDVTNYNAGKRGGKVRVRARMEISKDKKAILIKEIPFGITTGDLIESILKAGEKGKIKIKKVSDNTAKDVEIYIELQPGVSPDVTMDALYAFSDCEYSISINACIIVENKPLFTDVHEILRVCTDQTKELLRRELELKMHDLQEKWHFTSLEKIFIEKRIYHNIEEAESWEEVMKIIPTELSKYVRQPKDGSQESGVRGQADTRLILSRDISEEDITRLTEIRIKRISKYNTFEADEQVKKLLEEMAATKHNLENLTAFAISFYEDLLKRYGKGRERKTEIKVFDTIQATNVVANNAKLYINRKEGFIGLGLKKDELIQDCSDIDDVIIFRRDGKYQVVKVADKVFVGKDIIHAAVWQKGDERTTYNAIYLDGKTGITYSKRFNVPAVTRQTEYDITQGTPNSKLLYFAARANGESEVVNMQLTPQCTAKIKTFDFDFGELAIKGRSSQGNIVTKYPVRQVKAREVGMSSLGAKKWYFDDIVGRLNDNERGKYLGTFDTGETVLVIYKDAHYELSELDTARHFDNNTILLLEKFTPETVITAVYFEGNKEVTLVKRFKVETTKTNEKFMFITEHKKSNLMYATTLAQPFITYAIKMGAKKMVGGEIDLAKLIDVKGWKALGNKVSDQKLIEVKEVIKPAEERTEPAAEETKAAPETKFKAGETIEFDF